MVRLLLSFSAPYVVAGVLGFLRKCINSKLSSESDAWFERRGNKCLSSDSSSMSSFVLDADLA